MADFYIFTLVFFVFSFLNEILFDELEGQRGIFIFLMFTLVLISMGTGLTYGIMESRIFLGILLFFVPYFVLIVMAYFEEDITLRIRKTRLQKFIYEMFSGLD